MASEGPLWLAALEAIGGVAALRVAWTQPKRSRAGNGLGWGLIALAGVVGALAAGAWGVAIAALAGMGAAFALLSVAAFGSPRIGAPASNRRVGMLPEAGEPLALARRGLTFALTVLIATGSALCVAVALRGVAELVGTSEANSNVTALFAMPLAWAGLVYVVLMTPRRRTQLHILGLAALPALPVVFIGKIA
ncbi:hypothetical protein EKN06_00465 [Croceicoccus ponticola]|uniref:Uncharacterized protein n=1 Tax=Croceicoccus ponticola TaxID=2217664 RepID=A0A437GZM9_9SPHN|nr:hypothetical protein [Croceicoccus ponticola]RVQ68742.1 hypothetical protein EKN06_00465 [Croceicoccus ponticola]